MKPPSRRARGFALIAVIMMFNLIGAATLSLVLLFAAQNQRTHATIAGSQLRQLLLAAETFSAQELRQHGSAPRELQILPPVPNARLALSISPQGNQKAQIRALATLPHASATQLLTYTHADDGTWRLESAVLRNDP